MHPFLAFPHGKVVLNVAFRIQNKLNQNNIKMLNQDDPKLTAFVLGELSADEAQTIQSEIDQSPELQQSVKELKATIDLIEQGYADEPSPPSVVELKSSSRGDAPARPSLFTAKRIAIAFATLAASVAILFWYQTQNGETTVGMVNDVRDRHPRQQGNMQSEVIKGLTNDSEFYTRDKTLIFNDTDNYESTVTEVETELVDAIEARNYTVKLPNSIELQGKVRTAEDAPNDGTVFLRRIKRNKRLSFGADLRGDVDFLHSIERNKDSFIPNSEQYESRPENPFTLPKGIDALSTFAVDVDTASYANIRRFIQSNQTPPPAAVRLEEMVNYFKYNYPQPSDVDKDGRPVPFSVNTEIASCPWNAEHRLVRVALKGKEIHRAERPPSNLVFLIDVSGSMSDQSKLPLLKQGLQMMVDRLTENDTVSIVTYAGNAGICLLPTNGMEKAKIRKAIAGLGAGGSTHGSAGINKAYELAAANFIEDGTNRVILGTDGDLNVGITADQDLVTLITEKAASGTYLTVLGFGTGNLKDAKMEKIANNGNGIYAYIDNSREAHKVLVEQMSGSLVTIAKNVKIQLEFNPTQVGAYRLLGYENRVMAAKEFRDNQKDAGEIGAGHTVTAFYEVVPIETLAKLNADKEAAEKAKQPTFKYQANKAGTSSENAAVKSSTEKAVTVAANPNEEVSKEMFTVRLRYMSPEQKHLNNAIEIEYAATDDGNKFRKATEDFRFAASVIAFGLHLKQSEYRGKLSLESIEEIASTALGEDVEGYRAEFLSLVRKAMK